MASTLTILPEHSGLHDEAVTVFPGALPLFNAFQDAARPLFRLLPHSLCSMSAFEERTMIDAVVVKMCSTLDAGEGFRIRSVLTDGFRNAVHQARTDLASLHPANACQRYHSNIESTISAATRIASESSAEVLQF